MTDVSTITVRWPRWYGHAPLRCRLYRLPPFIGDEWKRWELEFLRWRMGWSIAVEADE